MMRFLPFYYYVVVFCLAMLGLASCFLLPASCFIVNSPRGCSHTTTFGLAHVMLRGEPGGLCIDCTPLHPPLASSDGIRPRWYVTKAAPYNTKMATTIPNHSSTSQYITSKATVIPVRTVHYYPMPTSYRKYDVSDRPSYARWARKWPSGSSREQS